MHLRSHSSKIACFLVFAGVVLSLSIFLNIKGLSGVFTLPGSFLFRSFSWASFYIPLYLVACAVLLFLPRFPENVLLMLTMGIIPFLTLSVLLKLGLRDPLSPILIFFLDSFGRTGSMVLLFLCLPMEILLIVSYRNILSGISLSIKKNPVESTEQKSTSDESDEAGAREKEEILADRYSDLNAENSSEREGSISKDETSGNGNSYWYDENFSFHLPEVPELQRLNSLRSERDTNNHKSLINRAEAEDADYEEVSPEEEWENLSGEGEDLTDEVDSFWIDPRDSESVEHIREWAARRRGKGYHIPVDELLNDYPNGCYWEIDEETKRAAEVLKTTLSEFKIQAEVTGIRKGPVITMFEILPAPGVKLSKIVNLADNIALRLAASRVRIVAPIPGKHAVGIEVPNRKRAIVSFREMIPDVEEKGKDMEIPLILGKDISGESQIIDLPQTPHLLIAGATGSGKSVCVNSIICSILHKRSPAEVRLLLIDPKIVELKFYNDIPHLLTPVITDPQKAYQALQYCICEMERRYSLLDHLGVRDIRSYNRKIKRKKLTTEPLPYIVIIVDEFADLMSTTGKELESTLARLAAMSRAVGLHLVLATQRPSIDVITGLIKANIPSRIAFMVASKFDSRIIIDSVGAEKLLGQGDMLFTSAWDPVPVRIQGAYLSEEEVLRVTEYVKNLQEPDYIDEEIFIDDEEDEDTSWQAYGSDDPLMDKALEIVVTAGKASASYLQRRLKIGYNRAARLVEEMEHRGIVGPQQGSKPREILHVPDRHFD